MHMLRDYQTTAVDEVLQAWNEGAAYVMLTAPTGSGKTVIMGEVVRRLAVPSVAIAHRQELVSQICLQLNREEIPHSIISPRGVIRQIVALEMDTHGVSYYEPRSTTRVAAVGTLVRRVASPERWMHETKLVLVDEGHHCLRDNSWGKVVQAFPNARGLFLTAHAIRGDGAGLGRHADGLVDRLVVGVSARRLIDKGMLCGYRYICAESDLNLESVRVTASGEFNQEEVRAAVHASPRIVGDVVKAYLKFAPGKLGITFAVDIDSAKEISAAYRAAGVPAEIITGETGIEVRGALMRQFRNGQIKQLVSVDVLGEGVDVPAVEVVSMARPTASFQLYAQQTGRALRTLVDPVYAPHWNAYTDEQRKQIIADSTKPTAIIIDHVQNWLRHDGLPDKPRVYTLDRRERKSKSDVAPLKRCTACWQPYERFLVSCPNCGDRPIPVARGTPEQVDGDLIELDLDVIRALEQEKERVDGEPNLPFTKAAHDNVRHHHYARQQAQQELRRTMSLWMGWKAHEGFGHREAQKLFYLTYQVDVLTAQSLNARDAAELSAGITAHLRKFNITEAA